MNRDNVEAAAGLLRPRPRALATGLSATVSSSSAARSAAFAEVTARGPPPFPLPLSEGLRMSSSVMTKTSSWLIISQPPSRPEGLSPRIQVAPSGAAAQPEEKEQGAYQKVSILSDRAKSRRPFGFCRRIRAGEQNTPAAGSRRG